MSRRNRLLMMIVALSALVSAIGLRLDSEAAAQDAAPITVETDEATSDFPNGLNFTLQAEGDEPITEVELLFQTADVETLNQYAPPFRPGEQIDLEYSLDFRAQFQPSGIDITYHWRLTDESGDVLETEPKTLLWYDNRFEWETETSDNVTVYHYRGNTAFAKVILDSAQSTVDRLRDQYGLTEIIPIRIWVYNSGKDFSSAQQGNSSEWIAGTAYPVFHVILAVLPEGNQREVGRVVPHEISHQLLAQATKNPFNAPPVWFDEGLAVYNQDGGNEDDLSLVENAAEKGRLFSVRALNSRFPFDPSETVLAYAQSYALVKFILDTYGDESLAAIISAYRTGVSHDDAMKAAIGVDLDELDRLFKESLNYPGDQPRAAGTSQAAARWDQFIGPGLASGSLILFGVLAFAVIARFTSRHRHRLHRSPEM